MSSAPTIEIKFPLHGVLPNTDERKAGCFMRITQVLSLAILFDDMIQSGAAKDYADVARQHCLSRERVSQIVRLNYLAPEIQIEVLYLPPMPSGRYPISETALRKIADMLSWAEQRREWALLRERHHINRAV